MPKSNIDYSKEKQQSNNQNFNKYQLLRELHNISPKDRSKLERTLSDNKATYSRETVEKANDLLDLLNDEGINYDLIARNNGDGLLAKSKGLGGMDLTITIAPKNEMKWDKDAKKNVLKSRDNYVGNINVNGRNYYMDRKTEMVKQTQQQMKDAGIKKKSPESKKLWTAHFKSPKVQHFDKNGMKYLLKGLTGQLPIETEYYDEKSARKDNNYDNAHTILDNQREPIVKFYRRKQRDENELEFDNFMERYNYLKNEDKESVKSKPLAQMVKETNQLIKDNRDDDGQITRDVKGFEETETFEEINIEDETTYNGLNLDTLLAFNNRSDIAKVVSEEIRVNNQFSLNNDKIEGEKGLKDLLMEETAGINPEFVDPNNLGTTEIQSQKYVNILKNVEKSLKRQGIDNTNVNFDKDHVIHWSGVNKADNTEKQGEIGQVFLPDENGVIKTKFKTLDDSEDRNYNLVAGYTAYYASNNKDTTIKPKTITLTDGKGNQHEVVATTEKDEQGNDIPFRTANGNFMRPERFPENEVVRFNKRIKSYNKSNPDDMLPLIATEEKERTLRDRLRLKGYEQSLQTQLDATIARQIIVDDEYSVDNTSLNKLYHGDVYGIRISDKNIQNSSIVATYNNRVKFENDVLDIPMNELDSEYTGDAKDYEGDDYSHRFNIKELDGIFDRSVSTDGANLGLVRYLTKNTKVLSKTGEVVPPMSGIASRAKIIDDMPFSEADPGDRSMMGANQYMKSRNVEKSVVALMTYKGYTFEDGAVVSERFAEKQGEIVNGYDEEGNIKPLQIGDKISDMHGNKATISYIANKEDDVFKENPSLDVIMNPHSIPSRMNTGVPLEMVDNGVELEIKHNGEKVANAGLLNVVITDITAEDKTKTYDDVYDMDGNLVEKSLRKGRSFGVQEAWVANALELDHTMKEIYGKNTQAFRELKAYMNVTGLDFDEDLNVIKSNGYGNGNHRPDERFTQVEIKDPLQLPDEGGYMELPTEVTLPSGMKTKYLNVLEEKYRSTQDLYDGDSMYHEYSTAYNKIAKEALKYNEITDRYEVGLTESINNLEEQDLSQYDLSNEEDRVKLRKALTNEEDIKEFDLQTNAMNRAQSKQQERLQGKVNELSSRMIDDKLGGRSKLTEREDKFGDKHMTRTKDSNAVKQSILKRSIMGKQVPNSVTSVVTAEPNVDIDTIKVSPEIYNKLDMKSADERALLWRDPALHDGSMRAFKVEKDENLRGVGINPLVTESFGMDFDGDTVGVYKPKTKEAQQELKEKAALEKNLIDATSKEFSGNIGMDFVSSAYENGYIRDNKNDITQGPLVNREKDITDENGELIKPKDQLQFMLNEMAQQEDGAEKINELWKEVVTSEKNIATSKVDFINREAFKASVMNMAEKGAKGKPDGIENHEVAQRIAENESNLGQKMTYKQRMAEPNKYISNQSTVMDYYDRGKEMVDLKRQYQRDGNKQHIEDYKYLYNPYTVDNDGNTIRNKGSLGYDQDKTRMAQAGKTDLTGLAGAKSQTLVGLMYDKEGGAMAAMEVTEPLTQATLKLKHDPNQTPKIKKLLEDYDGMLSQGGYGKEDFKETFKTMYDDVGLDVRDEHLESVFNTLSEKDGEGNQKTMPIQDAIEKRMNPLMKVNLYGYDAMNEMANGVEKNTEVAKGQWEKQTLDDKGNWQSRDINQEKDGYGNMKVLKDIALGYKDVQEAKLSSLAEGVKSKLHIPDNISEVAITSRKSVADNFAKEHHCGKYQKKEHDFKSREDIKKPQDPNLNLYGNSDNAKSNLKAKKGFDIVK